MRTSASGIALIEEFEGFRSTIYLDLAGYSTIGYGHKVLPGETFPLGITEAEGVTLLEGDLSSTEAGIDALVTVPLTQGQFDALASFTYNMGVGSLKQSTLLRMLNSGNYEDACSCLYSVDETGEQHGWIYAAGVIQPGLVRRRQAEQALWKG